jgi:protein-disulfide isomerase
MRDIAMGLADAPVTIVEYASVTCAACQHFQTDILPRLKARYILTGEAKFVLRDHPTPPAPVSFAAFALARCAGESEYYAVIGDFFAKQTDILAAARNGNARPYIVQIGAAHGLSQADVEACIKNPVLQAYIEKELDDAPDMTAAPAVFVNDKRVAGFTFEAISNAVDEAIAAARVAALPPTPEEVPPSEPSAAPPEAPADPAPAAPAPPTPAPTSRPD